MKVDGRGRRGAGVGYIEELIGYPLQEREGTLVAPIKAANSSVTSVSPDPAGTIPRQKEKQSAGTDQA